MSEKSQKRVEKSAWKLCPGPPCGGEAAWPTALPPSGAGGGVVLRVHLAIPTGASGYRKSFTLWNRSQWKIPHYEAGTPCFKGVGGALRFFHIVENSTLWKKPSWPIVIAIITIGQDCFFHNVNKKIPQCGIVQAMWIGYPPSAPSVCISSLGPLRGLGWWGASWAASRPGDLVGRNFWRAF